MKTQLAMLANYHLWAYETLFAALAALDASRYRADCGLFFRSVHGTLNHILLAERVWHCRCRNEPGTFAALDEELYRSRDELESAIYAQARTWTDLIGTHDEAGLAADVVYRNLAGREYTTPLSAILLHVFNHATHHRGQISAALSGAGLQVPEMDLIYFLRPGG